MNRDQRYPWRDDEDDFNRNVGHDASAPQARDPYRQAQQRGRQGGQAPRDPAWDARRQQHAGNQEPWRNPAPSFGYQGEGTSRAPGTRETRDRVRSRSADPGQSSYGGFSGQDPSYQREQVYGSRQPTYSGPTSYGDDEGGYYGDRPQWADEPEASFETAERGGYNRGPTAWRDRGSRRTDPKGYTRTDERVRENVCEHLAHSGLDVSDVSVAVADGCVTLEGTVHDRRTKHRIEDCADACVGVQDVDNRIRVAGAAEKGAASA